MRTPEPGATPLRRTRTPTVALLWLAFASVWAEAGPERAYLQGHAWELDIVSGVEDQDRERRRNRPVEALVVEATRRARRTASVANVYLQARAYGLRFAQAREQAKASQGAEERERLERGAEQDLANALSAYREVLTLDSRCYFAHHDMAVLESTRRKRERRRAFDHLVQALRINERYLDARRKLILLYLEGKQTDNAVSQLEALLRQDPEDHVARLQATVGLAELGRFLDAERHLAILISRQPNHPGYLDMQGQIAIGLGRPHDALETFRRLARINPNVPQPFVGMMRAAEAMRELAPTDPVPFDDMLFALRGLLRIERDEEKRARLEKDIQMVETARLGPTPGSDPKSMPQAQQVLLALKHAPDEQDRARAIYWFLTRDEPIDAEVLREIAKRLPASVEPSSGVRTFAVRALGHAGGTAVAPLVLLALEDEVAEVRGAAVDTLAGIGMRDPKARRPLAIALLARQESDGAVAAAIRHTVLRWEGRVLELPAEEGDEAHRAAFAAYLASDDGVDLLASGLEQYDVLGDRYPTKALAAFLDVASGTLARSAYEALGRQIGRAGGDGVKSWLASRPMLETAAFRAEAWPATRRVLSAWAATHP